METRRTYRFWPDGRYEYWNELCQSYDVCQGPYEAGVATVAGPVLSLAPQTDSAEGPRGYQFAVMRDPAVGDVQLHLVVPGGVDVFYYTP